MSERKASDTIESVMHYALNRPKGDSVAEWGIKREEALHQLYADIDKIIDKAIPVFLAKGQTGEGVTYYLDQLREQQHELLNAYFGIG